MVGTFGVALSTMYFGLSSSLTDLLLSRAIGVCIIILRLQYNALQTCHQVEFLVEQSP